MTTAEFLAAYWIIGLVVGALTVIAMSRLGYLERDTSVEACTRAGSEALFVSFFWPLVVGAVVMWGLGLVLLLPRGRR